MTNNSQRNPEARRRAQQLWDRQKRKGDVVLSERAKQHQVEMEKMARLKSLRLAKEAADREAAKLASPVRRKRSG
jgi:hypothetical protein